VLLTQILREQDGATTHPNPFADVHCYAFACPSCLSRELSESCRPFITTLVGLSLHSRGRQTGYIRGLHSLPGGRSWLHTRVALTPGGRLVTY
jgi:hypothetical protein